jgi:hypothetical protein
MAVVGRPALRAAADSERWHAKHLCRWSTTSSRQPRVSKPQCKREIVLSAILRRGMHLLNGVQNVAPTLKERVVIFAISSL